MGLRGPKTWGVRVVEEEAADRFLNLILMPVSTLLTSPDYGICPERRPLSIHRRDELFCD